jgi:formylglycine-generating enzyme required for sulfatase activity
MRTYLLALVALLSCALFTAPAPAQRETDPAKDKKDPGRKGGEVVEVEIAKGVKMTFCWIPAGEAQLGSPKAERLAILKLLEEEKESEWLASEAEEVRGKFKTTGFWLAKFPVTQEQWRVLMTDNPSPSFFSPRRDEIKKAGITDMSRFPVEGVSWNECQDFLKAMNAQAKVPAAMGRGKFALPHGDEWEYACRGGKGNKRPFYFGDRLNGDLANCDGLYPFGTDTKGEHKGRTTEVGEYERKAPHPWGLCDMHGNVWQWCDDKHKQDGDSRVICGGSWLSAAPNCRAAYRPGYASGNRNNDIGLRPCFRPD